MDFYGPPGPHGNRYAVDHADGVGPEPRAASHDTYATRRFTASGPHGADQGWRHESPCFTLESSTARCVLTVEEGCVLTMHWDRDCGLLYNPTSERYKLVWGFIIANIANDAGGNQSEVKIVHCANKDLGMKETAGIWQACLGDVLQQMRLAFYDCFWERGLDTIDDDTID